MLNVLIRVNILEIPDRLIRTHSLTHLLLLLHLLLPTPLHLWTFTCVPLTSLTRPNLALIRLPMTNPDPQRHLREQCQATNHSPERPTYGRPMAGSYQQLLSPTAQCS